LWGATGFTGKLAFEYLVQNAPEGFKYAVAGRNKTQLEAVRGWVANRVGADAERVEIIIADSTDQNSIDEMVKQTKVILSTVGPFMKYGTPLVDACVRFGTHYVDSTGESPFVQSIINKYHDTAKKQGTVLVPMCGFDSIPSDMGVFFIQKELKQKANSVCSLVELGGGSGPSGGTMASMLNLISDKKNGRIISNPFALVPTPPKREKARQKGRKKFISYNSTLKMWTIPFVMEAVNTQVVQRSNYLLDYGKESFAYSEALAFKSFVSAVLFYITIIIFLILARIPWTRENIVRRVVPQPGTGPSESVRKRSFFHYHYLADVGDKKKETKYLGHMSGGEPGYDETAKMLVESSLCLATQRDQLPIGKEGGVLTPASAMGHLLLERLKKVGLGIASDQDKAKSSSKH